jgi:hypothetical protein
MGRSEGRRYGRRVKPPKLWLRVLVVVVAFWVVRTLRRAGLA